MDKMKIDGAAAPILVSLSLFIVACNPSNPAPTDDAATVCAGRCGISMD